VILRKSKKLLGFLTDFYSLFLKDKSIDYEKYKKFYDLLLKLKPLNQLIVPKLYNAEYYTSANELKSISAKKVAEVLFVTFKPSTVVDLGCGMGLYISELHKLGVEVIGCDISFDAMRISPKEFTIFYADLRKPIFLIVGLI